MKFMDMAAGAVAMKYAKGNCVTARVDEIEFHLPIFIGALVTCTASIVYVGHSSMEVFVNVEAEDLEGTSRSAEGTFCIFHDGIHGQEWQTAAGKTVHAGN